MSKVKLRKQLLQAARDVESGRREFSCVAVYIRTNPSVTDAYTEIYAGHRNPYALWNWDTSMDNAEKLKLSRTLAILFFREFINEQ